MWKRTKRKVTKNEEADFPEKENRKESISGTAATRAKRVKASKPHSVPEYFEDKRNLEDLWKAAFPVGTEWDQLDSFYQYNWNFSNLEDAFEEGGKLYGEKEYLFGSTERCLTFPTF
ncbi:unnamed protein product [Citrullus colocynthis]|uniref:Uncharacterized protein n=1 Tax=Citrullus colocynthis TaxID=252529 RepID=A0ABP0YJS8_9ROSI